MSLSLKNLDVEQWGEIGNNSDQDYLTHSTFRYFGKLPPVLTRRILEEFVPKYKNPLVVDLMCGSGTTLVEAQSLGFRSVGIDSNDIAVLVSRAKTSPLPIDAVENALAAYRKDFLSGVNAENCRATLLDRFILLEDDIPNFKNVDLWFLRQVKVDLALCRRWVEEYRTNQSVYDFLFMCWLGIIRQCSNASVRAGRIFRELNKKFQPVFYRFLTRMEKNLSTFKDVSSCHFDPLPRIFLGDARKFKLPLSEKSDFTFFHPPYFALYKYSSDVLRFELEWARFKRKEIQKKEIADGFKTTNADLMYVYVDDLVECIANGFRFTKEGNYLGIVIGNSTLREEQLPIIPTLLEKCKARAIRCERVIERPIKHSQATYHKSANPNINSKADYILIFARD